jgi:hypothetical protein
VIADIALPEPIDPEERVIRFIQVVCRCDEKSPVARDPMQDKMATTPTTGTPLTSTPPATATTTGGRWSVAPAACTDSDPPSPGAGLPAWAPGTGDWPSTLSPRPARDQRGLPPPLPRAVSRYHHTRLVFTDTYALPAHVSHGRGS